MKKSKLIKLTAFCFFYFIWSGFFIYKATSSNNKLNYLSACIPFMVWFLYTSIKLYFEEKKEAASKVTYNKFEKSYKEQI